MRLLLSILALAVLAGALSGCGTKTPLQLPPAPAAAVKPQPTQLSPDHHSNAPGTSQ